MNLVLKFCCNFFICLFFIIKQVNSANEVIKEETLVSKRSIIKFDFHHVSAIYTITLWILLGSLVKVCFHILHKLTEKLPESCLLIILGLIVGGILKSTNITKDKSYVLDSETFLLFLLPPIIFEAGYFMPNRPFFDNIGTILLFAIGNTLFNILTIGLTLWSFSGTWVYGGLNFDFLHCFLFASLISAVDPVAVLATFVEIHVNDMLYIVVFGESLLNDAVSVVVYRLFDTFSFNGMESIDSIDITIGIAWFFVVAIGSVIVGVIFGFIGCFTTKFTQKTPIFEPLIILSFSYLSYLTAEMFALSGILAITFCGLLMKQYVKFNISKQSKSTIEYVVKMLANIMETIIFIFMGISTISDFHSWNPGFLIVTLLSCAIYRFIGVFIFANIANRGRLIELKATDMLIMSYGGIRGAVAFALALILDESVIPRKKEFVTATIAVVFFTVFVQGATIGPIVKYFKIKRKEVQEKTMSVQLTVRLLDQLMSCMEDIAEIDGKFSLLEKIRKLDKNYLRPLLLRDNGESSIDQRLLNSFKKIAETSLIKMADSQEIWFQSSSFLNKDSVKGKLLQTDTDQNQISTQTSSKHDDITVLKNFENEAILNRLLDNSLQHSKRVQRLHRRSTLEEDYEPNERTRRPNKRYEPDMHHHSRVNMPNLIDNSILKNQPKTKKQSKNKKRSKSLDASSINQHKNTTNEYNSKKVKFLLPQSPSIGVNIPPPWRDLNDNKPVVANDPTWANNPEYIQHPTTSKPEDKNRISVFDTFESDS